MLVNISSREVTTNTLIMWFNALASAAVKSAMASQTQVSKRESIYRKEKGFS